MAKTLAQLDAQIAKLQRQAEALRAREVAGVIARIKVAIDYYGLTAADLGFGSARGSSARAGRGRSAAATRTRAAAGRGAGGRSGARKTAGRKPAGVVRFRDEAGNSWTGHGKRPGWFKDALAAGKTPEDLAVKNG
ncbi:MAG: H-NS histone family protein [Xanthomonadaceae bacterium]|nr:H-NS histone family protein [Xanthomonadaceae bacterium]